MFTEKKGVIKDWQERFDQNPLMALDRFLTDRVYMGILEPNDKDEILFRLFVKESENRLAQLDKAMLAWFKKCYEDRDKPSSIVGSRWNAILRDALSTVRRLQLNETLLWLRENRANLQSWLQGLVLAPGSNPEADLLWVIGPN